MHAPNKPDPFAKYESGVMDKLRESNVPYLGLIDGLLSESTLSFIKGALTQAGGTLANFERGLRLSPALFVSYLVHTIRKNLGGDAAGSAVYGCINLAMGRAKDARQDNEERRKLWKAFCLACKKLELPLSNRLYGSNYMVDAYLEQTGLAEAYLKIINERMDKFACKVGLPDPEDYSAQKAWYDEFRNLYGNSFGVRTHRALINDTQGYYLSQFLNAITSIETFNKNNNSKILQVEPHRIAASPLFLFDGDELSIVFPGCVNDIDWKIKIDDHVESIQVKDQDKKICFYDYGLNRIELIVSNITPTIVTLWEGDLNNQFAIFNCDDNVFVGRYDLTQEGVALSPGRYRILSRFPISENWVELEESYQEGFFIGEFDLRAGHCHYIKRGPITFTVSAHSEARMVFEGDEVIPYSGKNFFTSSGLKIAVDLPLEWLSSQSKYELELYAGEIGERRIVPVSVDSDNRILIELDFQSLGWKPGMARVRAVLKKENERRELVRQSALVWFGLRSLANGFTLDLIALPENIDIEKSKNVRIDKEKNELKPIDYDVQFTDLSFALSGNRRLKFRFALLGTFLYISNLEDGFRNETNLPIGSILSSSFNDTRRIRIFSTEDGCLRIGGHTIHESFLRKPWCNPSIASLLDKITRDDNKLVLETSKYSLPLLRIVSPYYVDNWKIEFKARSIDITFKSPVGFDEFVVQATNLISLSSHKKIFSTDATLCNVRNGEISGLLINRNNHDLSQMLTLNTDALSDGVWFIEFDFAIKGKWGSITNQRKDHYGLGVVVERGRIVTFSSNILTNIQHKSPEHKRQLFNFVNVELKKCYEINCWNSLSWIKEIWCCLVKDNDVVNNDRLSQVLSLTQYSPSDIDSPSWVPQVHMGAFNITLYGRESRYYRHIDVKNSVNLRCLKLIGDSEKNLGSCLQSELIAASVVVAFENRSAIIANNAVPESLNINVLAAMLPSVFNEAIWRDICSGDFVPVFGDMLGGAHLAYCQYSFLVNARRAQDGNEFHRPAHNNMVFKFAHNQRDVLPLLVFDDFFESETERELLESVCYFSSVFAKACRGVVWNGEDIEPLLNRLKADLLGENTKLENILSYYLIIAGELFHYYLLLWDIYFISIKKIKEPM